MFIQHCHEIFCKKNYYVAKNLKVNLAKISFTFLKNTFTIVPTPPS